MPDGRQPVAIAVPLPSLAMSWSGSTSISKEASMARTADHQGDSRRTVGGGQRRPPQQQRASEPDAAVVVLARLIRILGQAMTTHELPPEDPGIVELGDEVVVEFATGDTKRYLLVDPIEAPLDDVRISVGALVGTERPTWDKRCPTPTGVWRR